MSPALRLDLRTARALGSRWLEKLHMYIHYHHRHVDHRCIFVQSQCTFCGYVSAGTHLRSPNWAEWSVGRAGRIPPFTWRDGAAAVSPVETFCLARCTMWSWYGGSGPRAVACPL
eukprot:217902-Chlamydomonas_euryale.AAC.2